jgi:hypothetical protein
MEFDTAFGTRNDTLFTVRQIRVLEVNPVANIPNWKWEGYAEYISRQDADQKNLSKNIARLIATKKSNWQVTFADSTIVPREYYASWIMVQYCMNIKKMTYKQILADTTSEQNVTQEMMKWYERIHLDIHGNIADQTFGSGYTMYSAAWPIFKQYPGPQPFPDGIEQQLVDHTTDG